MANPTTLPAVSGITHHTAAVNGTTLHYVSAGVDGSPILLVHGFPETWWAFHKLIPLLAKTHRVIAVDLRGFGDSEIGESPSNSQTAAEDVHQLIGQLGVGPVHLTGQDITGSTVFRLAATHPEDVRSVTGIEMGLAGLGWDKLVDRLGVAGTWHIGVMAAPGIPELLLSGRESEFLGGWAFPAMTAVRGAVSDADVAEFVRSYPRAGGWRGASGLYRSMLAEGNELVELARTSPLRMPVLAVGGAGGPFTAVTLSQVASHDVESVIIEGVGHYVALEAPTELARALLAFTDRVDQTP